METTTNTQNNSHIKKDPFALKLHQHVLAAYAIFQEICSKNNLQFFAISGTTIGAALWNGIIPWDDDIDIAMPPKDFEKFIKICKDQLPPHYHIQEYPWFGAKLYNDTTMFTNVYYIMQPERYNGVFLDIVPLFPLPNDEAQRNQVINLLNSYREETLLLDRYGIRTTDHTKSDLRATRSQILYNSVFGETEYVMDFSDPRYILPSKGFLKPQILPFENTTMPISSNWEEDLHIQYKNLQKYPPKKVRNSIHNQFSIIDLNKSYQEYAKDFKSLPEWVTKVLNGQHLLQGNTIRDLYAKNNDLNQVNQARHDISYECQVYKNKLISCEKELQSYKSELSLLKQKQSVAIKSKIKQAIKKVTKK